MKTLLRLLSFLIAYEVKVNSLADTKLQLSYVLKKHSKVTNTNIYQQFLLAIQKEISFDAVLILQQHYPEDPRLEAIYHIDVPKVIITKDEEFRYKTKFNSVVFTVILQDRQLDLDMAAKILQFMRQARIWLVATNVADHGRFKAQLLAACRRYRMTNVLLHFCCSQHGETELTYSILKPYPEYHWVLGSQNITYFPSHWRNMHNSTLVTTTDKGVPRSLVYQDAQGYFKINGYVSRLVLLFAQHFNASLKLYQPLNQTPPHFITINQLVADNLVDLPLTSNPVYDEESLHGTYVCEVGQSTLMVPCAQSLNISEVFGIVLNVYFLGWIFLCTWLLSMVHSLSEYICIGVVTRFNFLLSYRIFPGILGQSFVARKSPSHSLKIIYLLVFIAGLNISTQFSANIQSFFTTPPLHDQIRTFKDINKSSLQILFNAAEYPLISDRVDDFADSIVLISNYTMYQELRKNFNTTYGYMVPSAMWKIFTRMQRYFTHKIFCTFDGLKMFDLVPWTIRLQHNSPLKEPLDLFILRVHELGLMQAWLSSTIDDMLKLKQISILDPNPRKRVSKLAVSDLSLVWLIWLGGLVVSSLVFVVEFFVVYKLRKKSK